MVKERVLKFVALYHFNGKFLLSMYVHQLEHKNTLHYVHSQSDLFVVQNTLNALSSSPFILYVHNRRGYQNGTLAVVAEGVQESKGAR